QCRFGDLPFELGRGQSGGSERTLDTADKIRLLKLECGNVHRNRHIDNVSLPPRLSLAADFMGDPGTDVENQAALFRYGNKLQRRYQPVCGMLPAGKGFYTHYATILQRTLGLIGDKNFA